jgi:hypothetical protein
VRSHGAVRSQAETEGRPIAFIYKLEQQDGTPVEPPMFRTAVPTWNTGDTIPLGARILRVLGVHDDADQPPALVIEDLPGSATSTAG